MPVLVEFASDFDQQSILQSARNLKDLQAEYPRVSIAPDRTKKQQELHRQQRAGRAAQSTPNVHPQLQQPLEDKTTHPIANSTQTTPKEPTSQAARQASSNLSGSPSNSSVN